MKIFAIAGSLRKDSFNRRLLEIASGVARREGAEVDLASLRDFEMPFYDGDLEAASGPPAGAQALATRITAADGLMIASPEYNYSVPAVLKNAIDWVSRMKPMPLRGKRAFLLSASLSLVGGNRGLWALRMPLEVLGVHVMPEMYSLATAHEKLGDGVVKDDLLAGVLDGMTTRFLAELRRGTS